MLASSSDEIPETWMRSPSRHAPSPRAAHQRRPSAGADARPHTTCPSRSSAISVAQTGMPREKFLVPSIGSTIQRDGSAVVAFLLAEHALAGPLARDPLTQHALGRAVGIGDRRQVRLRLDVQVGRTKTRQRQRVGGVGKLESVGEVGVHTPTITAQ